MRPVICEASDVEKRLIEHVKEGDKEKVTTLLKEPGIKVDCLDENGMTPLQHAAYKANKELVELLLANGANVNDNNHDHRYTALMFAALSGNVETTRILLEAGASVNHQNAVGRNAAQMAAFVGQHQVVSLINNFFSREDLDYYTTPRGLETEAKLPSSLAPSLYKLILSSNLNPVRLSMHLQQNMELLDDSYKVAKVLDILCEKHMKASDTNEVMAMKFHYLACLVRQADKNRNAKDGSLDNFIKGFVRGRDSDGFQVQQEMFIRSMLREFPYADSSLLQQIVRNIAKVTIGDSPTALSMLNQAINGQRFANNDDNECSTCGEFKSQSKCSACKMVHYCNQKCQKLHWPTHKKSCKTLRALYEQQQEEKIKQEEEERKNKEQEEKEQTEREENEGEGRVNVDECEDEKSETEKVEMDVQKMSVYEDAPSKQRNKEEIASGMEENTPVDLNMIKMEEDQRTADTNGDTTKHPTCPFAHGLSNSS